MRQLTETGDGMSDDTYQWLGEDELHELMTKYGKGMPVISFVTSASGAGKSTLAAHMAAAAMADGAGPVVALEMTKRGGLANWWTRRKGTKPPLASRGSGTTMVERLNRVRDAGAKLCLIDTASAADDDVEQAVAASSLVIIPCRPERKDLDAAREAAIVAHYLDKKTIFVINSAIPTARMNEAVAIELAKHATLAPVTIHRRAAIVTAMEEGRVIGEVDGEENAGREIAELWTYLKGRLDRLRN